jgi:hypothetical protein
VWKLRNLVLHEELRPLEGDLSRGFNLDFEKVEFNFISHYLNMG